MKLPAEIPPLPQGFEESLASLLQGEMQDFLQSYNMPFARGLRRNPEKMPEGGLSRWVEGLQEPVPWEPDGVYIPADATAGAHPMHEAGAYYLQEPSAMAAVAALDPKPSEWVLDLCAAPGGKSGQIAARMKGQGMLVSNEPVPARAQILARNMERLGVSHGLVTCETPERLLAKWPGLFHRVLVDAPCSGEGMFRRHPEAREEWTVESPAGCARRQRDILRCAAKMVRAGGVLCYSTCTFNTTENEGVVEAFLQQHPEFHLRPFVLAPGLAAPNGMLRLFPHKVRGEGHFVALMEKRGEAEDSPFCKSGLKPADRQVLDAYHAFCRENLAAGGPEPAGIFGGKLVAAPFLPDIKGIKVVRVGLHLGEARGKHFFPDHAWAMAMKHPQLACRVPVDGHGAAAYLRGEVLPVSADVKGWGLVTYGGLALGWGKAVDGMMKNHYPKGLRR